MRSIFVLFFCFYALLAGPVLANKADVEKATSQFYKALNSVFTGNVKPMHEIWSHASDATYMGPDGTFQTGWDKIKKEWSAQAAAKLGGEVQPKQVHTIVNGNVAIVFCIETGANIVNGKKEPVKIRASTLFRKEGMDWRVIGHQTDKLGFIKTKLKNNPSVAQDKGTSELKEE